MKFPRNAKIFRGHLDAAPFAGVFFVLLMFLLLTSLVYTPGVHIRLPSSSAEVPGVAGPTLAVAMDKNGLFYFQNQPLGSNELRQRLTAEVKKYSEPPTLVMLADQDASRAMLIQLADLAATAGITNAMEGTLPRPFDNRINPK